jgi:hypothetical protein
MTAFPSGVTNNVNTSNLDSATDQPKSARADLLTLTQRVNQMINSFNANSGICGLNAQGKVDGAKLIGQIDTAQLAGDAVNGDKIDDDAVDSEHILTGAVDYDHISFGSTATDLGGATPSNVLVPTQAAVRTALNNEVSSQLKPFVASMVFPIQNKYTSALVNNANAFNAYNSRSNSGWAELPSMTTETKGESSIERVNNTTYRLTLQEGLIATVGIYVTFRTRIKDTDSVTVKIYYGGVSIGETEITGNSGNFNYYDSYPSSTTAGFEVTTAGEVSKDIRVYVEESGNADSHQAKQVKVHVNEHNTSTLVNI